MLHFVALVGLLTCAPPTAAQTVCTKMKTPICNSDSRFRSLSGVCNNLDKPFLGAAETAFRRLVDPDYADGVSSPRESQIPGFPLPNCRKTSLNLFRDEFRESRRLTHMTMVFGQFLAHDVTLGGQPEGAECDASCVQEDPCIGITIPPTDPRFPGPENVQCIIVTRDRPCNEEEPRQQENILSSYIDASHIYGVNQGESNDVRDLRSTAGLLRTMPQNISTLEDLLPKANPHTFCRTPDPRNRPCFLTGDFRRNNENQGETSTLD